MASSNISLVSPAGALSTRRLPSWIDGYLDYTDESLTPRIFRQWSAISAIGAVLQRRVWVRFNRQTLYPNFFIILVGPSGVGKGMALRPIENILRNFSDDFVLAPTSVSKASLMDALDDGKVRINRPTEIPPYVEFNSLYVIAREFGHFLPTYESEFMAALTDLYDGEVYEERKRGGDLVIKVERPILNILGGTLPSYLQTALPEGAWEHGFASRTLMIFSAEQIKIDPLSELPLSDQIRGSLMVDLKSIYNMYGQFEWSPEAATLIRHWVAEGGEDSRPDHPKLLTYLSRRNTHLAKLCMVASASRSSSLVIEREDFALALDWLIEAEHYMPDIFKSMVVSGDAKAMDECHHYIMKNYVRSNKKPVPAHDVIDFLRQRVPAHSVLRVLEVMVRSNIIAEVDGGVPFVKFYKPVSQHFRTATSS